MKVVALRAVVQEHRPKFRGGPKEQAYMGKVFYLKCRRSIQLMKASLYHEVLSHTQERALECFKLGQAWNGESKVESSNVKDM